MVDAWLRNPAGPNWDGVAAIGTGFTIYLVLMAIKLHFPLWPVHPVAFPLAFAWAIDTMLPAIVITWLFKSLLLRYGGLRAHLRALPFFLGLIAGSATVTVLRSMLARILHVNL